MKKPCPNCIDGYEDTPPMRKCGICHGRCFVEVPKQKRMVSASDPKETSASAPNQRLKTRSGKEAL